LGSWTHFYVVPVPIVALLLIGGQWSIQKAWPVHGENYMVLIALQPCQVPPAQADCVVAQPFNPVG